MDLYLDRLLNLPNTTVESFTEEENKIILKLRFLHDEVVCPHCNTHNGKLKQNPEALFFCVGDDWQAINGFAGADLNYYKNFTQIYKPSHTLPITTNYRSGSQIVELGNKLMSDRGIPAKPSTQIQGKIQLVNIAKFQMTAIEEQEHRYDDLTAAIIRLTGKLIQEGKRVTLLSRKNLLKGVDYRIKKLDEFRKYILKKLNLVGDL